jgi:hypothetical protein
MYLMKGVRDRKKTYIMCRVDELIGEGKTAACPGKT